MSLSNYDYSKYPTWEQVKTPSGATYYVVPGTAFVYDPFLSQQKGKPVLWQNPKPQQDERAKAEKAAKDAASPLNQLLPVVGSTAGIVGSKYLIDALGPTSAATTAATTGGAQVAGQVAAQQAAQQAAAQGAGQTASLAAPELVDAGRVAGNVADVGANTMAFQDGLNFSNALSAAAVAKGGYDAQRGYEQGGEGVRSGLTTAGAGIGSLIMPGLGTAAGAAIGNTIGYGLQGSGWKNDLALLAAGGGITAPLIIARRMGVDLMHKTTKQVQQEHTQQLAEKAPEDAAWQNYLGGMRTQEVNKDAPFAGKYKTFDEYKKAGLQADDLTGVYGNLKTFGPEWAKLDFNKQKQVTQGLIDAGLYKSKKGEVEITDEDKAHEIKNQVLGIAKPTTATDAFAQGVGAKNLIGKIEPKPIVVNAEPPRSSTSSPGISKDGKVMSSKEIGKLLAKRMNKN